MFALSNRHTEKPVNFGIVVFPEFQARDVFGPLDALSLLSRSHEMNLFTIAETTEPVSTRLIAGANPAAPSATVPPAASEFAQTPCRHTPSRRPRRLTCSSFPGGQGTRYAGIEQAVEFTRERFPELQCLVTVCTGAGVAARAGVLDARRAMTDKLLWDSNVALRPEVLEWAHRARRVRTVTSGHCPGYLLASRLLSPGLCPCMGKTSQRTPRTEWSVLGWRIRAGTLFLISGGQTPPNLPKFQHFHVTIETDEEQAEKIRQ